VLIQAFVAEPAVENSRRRRSRRSTGTDEAQSYSSQRFRPFYRSGGAALSRPCLGETGRPDRTPVLRRLLPGKTYALDLRVVRFRDARGKSFIAPKTRGGMSVVPLSDGWALTASVYGGPKRLENATHHRL
jgi:hypothetical protein